MKGPDRFRRGWVLHMVYAAPVKAIKSDLFFYLHSEALIFLILPRAPLRISAAWSR